MGVKRALSLFIRGEHKLQVWEGILMSKLSEPKRKVSEQFRIIT
jgi:hypothetical protein